MNRIVKWVTAVVCSGRWDLIFNCSGNAAYNFTLSQVPLLPGTGQTITNNCPLMPSKCTGGINYGVQEYVYETQVTLTPCNQWRVSWATCCPTTNVISPMAIRVDEWRTVNGVPMLIGSVYHDLQINAIISNNTLPVLSGMDFQLGSGHNTNDTIYHTTACLGDPLEFFIHGFDNDAFHPVNIGSPEKFSISWNKGIQQASFQTYNQQTDSAYAHFYKDCLC